MDVAANRQQGGYLAVFIVAFTALPAGLIAWSSHPIIGVILTLAGLALMIHSLVGFYRITLGLPLGDSRSGNGLRNRPGRGRYRLSAGG